MVIAYLHMSRNAAYLSFGERILMPIIDKSYGLNLFVGDPNNQMLPPSVVNQRNFDIQLR